MARLVVDSSVVVKWFLPEALADKAVAILDDYRNGVCEFTVTDLLFAEVGNAAWKKQSLQGAAARDVALLLSDQHQRTLYDSLYLAASLRVNCPFVTVDQRLVNAVSGTLPNVEWLGNR